MTNAKHESGQANRKDSYEQYKRTRAQLHKLYGYLSDLGDMCEADNRYIDDELAEDISTVCLLMTDVVDVLHKDHVASSPHHRKAN